MFDLALADQDAPRPVAEIVSTAPDEHWRTIPPEQLMLIDTEEGTITVMLSSVLAQDHVSQARLLAREGYYEGLSFYRVIESFVAQGGDHTGDVDKGSAKETLTAEIEERLPKSATFAEFPYADGYAASVGYLESMPAARDAKTGTAWLAHCTGAFAYGRNNPKDSASTEFYITLQPQRYLDRNLTVLGRVIDGMELAQAAPRGVIDSDPATDDFPDRLMLKGMSIVSDLPENERPTWRILDDQSASFEEMVRARGARPDPFFYYRPNHANLCQVPIPVEKVAG